MVEGRLAKLSSQSAGREPPPHGEPPRKPGLLKGEEDPVSRSHTGSWIRGYARFLWRVSGFFTQILNPLFLVYPESFKNLGQILKQTWAKLMLSDQQLHLC